MIPVVAIFALAETVSVTPADASGQMQRIDAVCDEVLELSQNHEPVQILADFADAYDRDAPDDWRSVPDRATLDRLAETTFPYTQAFVWKTETATFVQIVLQGPSGDSVLSANYCFDAKGLLARSENTLNTFHAIDPETADSAPISRIKTMYYGLDREVLHTQTVVLDLKTLEPAPRRQYMNYEDPVFMDISSLPFSNLLSK